MGHMDLRPSHQETASVATPRHKGTVVKDRSQRKGDVRCASGV